MLLLQVPNNYLPERSYIIALIFKYFWELPYEIEPWSLNYTRLSIPDDKNSCELILEDGLFSCPETAWLSADSIPSLPLPQLDISTTPIAAKLADDVLPVIFGVCRQDGYIQITDQRIWLGIDILGASFFMLSRYEEYAQASWDEHNRFSAEASLACRAGFLERPLVNEYLEVLWWCIKRLWPGLQRAERKGRTFISHDVDLPFAYAFESDQSVIRSLGGDLIKRRSPSLMLGNIQRWRAVRRGDYKLDPNYTFGQIMDLSESRGLRSAFYFKAGCTKADYDYNYSLDHPYLRNLIREIGNRGHEIGLHPSYETYLSQQQTKVEFDKLLQVCAAEGIAQEKWGGRQHFLRWQAPTTWCNWAEAGLDYDSSMAYAVHSGFRCGICYEYPVYDLNQRRMLKLMERPLLVMEGSLLEKQYMNMTTKESLVFIQSMLERCRLYHGDFTLLFHNHSLTEPATRELYTNILKLL